MRSTESRCVWPVRSGRRSVGLFLCPPFALRPLLRMTPAWGCRGRTRCDGACAIIKSLGRRSECGWVLEG
jgi:hypothetical protein